MLQRSENPPAITGFRRTVGRSPARLVQQTPAGTEPATPKQPSTVTIVPAEPSSRTLRLVRGFAMLFLGGVFPIAVMVQAYFGLTALQKNMDAQTRQVDVVKMFNSVKKNPFKEGEANDYSMFSYLYSEQSARGILLNKQLLKVVVMQVGFAVASIGLMFIVLGIRDGGADSSVEAKGIKFDLKTGSTGLVTFVVGSAMVAGGGIIYNEYTTVGYPEYIQTGPSAKVIIPADIKRAAEQLEFSKDVYIGCKTRPDPDSCFAKGFANGLAEIK